MEQNIVFLLKVYDFAIDILIVLSIVAITLIAANINSNH